MTTTRIKKQIRKWHGHCIYRVREVKSPILEQFRGFRFEVAVPNMQGHKPFSSEPAPSFTRSYLLFVSSDWCSEELDEKVKGAIQFLYNRGFDKVEPSELYSARQELEMAKSKGTQHKEPEEV